jgi:predicted short-subunit dehydrogenase-like oxidoreductase (DUF2520 family)
MNQSTPSGFALVGPGRAGTAIAAALVAAGEPCRAVAGRTPDAASTTRAAATLHAAATTAADAAAAAPLVLVATPDAEIGSVAADLAATVQPGALVVHLSGARGLDALAPLRRRRPDVETGALHPLQTLTGVDDASRLAGAWAAVAGPPAVTRLAHQLGLRPFPIDDPQRGAYHAAAVVASNHLVALLGQVERLAAAADVPFVAFEPLVQATLDHVFTLGPAAALTGPVARGDVETVGRHLDTIADDERRAYTALADLAGRLTGRDDAALREVLA